MSTHSIFRRHTIYAVAGLSVMTACKGRTVSVSSGMIDTVAVQQFKTFSIMAPISTADTVAVAATKDSNRVAGAIMNMDPMLATSLVGRAIQQDLTNAFTRRGYQAVEGTPDFYVAYYAGTGHVVDTRASEQRYRSNGTKITRETVVYPAGTIVVDVVDARTDSLVWRGTGMAQIPKDPNDYAGTIHEAVDKIVGSFPKAQR